MSLYTIGIELTNACNLSCLHCLRDFSPPNRFLLLEILEKLCREVRPFGVKEFSFTGGEPTLHLDFSEAVDMVVRHGYGYSFVTNGYGFERTARMLSDEKRRAALTRVCFSLDGATEKTHDMNRGKGSFRRLMKAVSACHALDVPVMLQMSVGRHNRHEIQETALLAGQLGAKELFYSHILPTRDNLEKDILLPPEECVRVEDEVKRLQGALTLTINLSVGHHVPLPFYQCVALQMQRINVDYLGQLTLCCQISNYRGAPASRKPPDVIAHLGRTSFYEAMKKLVKKIESFNLDRLRAIAADHTGEGLYFPCVECARAFGKLSFLEDFPTSPWAHRDGRPA